MPPIAIKPLIALCAGLALAGCAVAADREQDYPSQNTEDQNRPIERYKNMEGGDATLFGDLSIGGPPKRQEGGAGEGVSAVNLYLWRATLETLSLGPLESADPFGGIIITDWFTLDEDPGSQYRVTAYIMGRALRSDNVRVALYVRADENGKTVTRRGTPAAEQKLENLILSKARTIRATQYR